MTVITLATRRPQPIDRGAHQLLEAALADAEMLVRDLQGELDEIAEGWRPCIHDATIEGRALCTVSRLAIYLTAHAAAVRQLAPAERALSVAAATAINHRLEPRG